MPETTKRWSSSNTKPPEVSDEPESTTEPDREAEPEVASASIVELGITEVQLSRSVVSTPKPFYRPHYDNIKRLGLVDLMPYKHATSSFIHRKMESFEYVP
jgi:hypothetical protein